SVRSEPGEAGRGTEGVFSLVTFSCTSKRKSRAGQDGRQDPQGRESVFASTLKIKDKTNNETSNQERPHPALSR
ncbi:MAG TPA: hypothetical protein VHC92_11310, partial [Rhodanobacteraceae bacterium]|nr:hypothetical protein [Rhodanobacteraceae bacterium]